MVSLATTTESTLTELPPATNAEPNPIVTVLLSANATVPVISPAILGSFQPVPQASTPHDATTQPSLPVIPPIRLRISGPNVVPAGSGEYEVEKILGFKYCEVTNGNRA
jgi:hypothetical protein